MVGETRETLVRSLGASLILPFVLDTPRPEGDYRIELILERLNALQELTASSRDELASLRQANEAILRTVGAGREQTPGRERSGATGARLIMKLLGDFEVSAGGQVVTTWAGKKPRLLLAYLAMERGRMVPKDVLIEIFWPSVKPERGANNLSIAVHQIRASLATVAPELADAVIVRGGLYGLDHEKVAVDLWQLRLALDRAKASLERNERKAVRADLIQAVSLARGQLLQNDLYEEWTVQARRTLSAASHKALSWLAVDAADCGDWSSVINFSERMLTYETCDEAAHRLLMLAHWKTGSRHLALKQYTICRSTLESELGVPPSQKTLRLYREIAGSGATA